MLLEVNNLTKKYKARKRGSKEIIAVDNFNLKLVEGETVGIIGPSGCGKSTTARMIAGLIKPTSGNVMFNNKDILKAKRKDLLNIRKDMQIIFQHPQQRFNPKKKIYDIMAEAIRLHSLSSIIEEEKKMVYDAIDRVGITKDQVFKYPSEISGGQAQRIAIARVLLLDPKLIIADEPTSMLDISVQAQILSTIKDIQNENNLAMIFISHDIDVVNAMCKRVISMKDGKIVKEELLEEKIHIS